MRAADPMDEDGSEFPWNSDKFLALREELMKDKTEAKATEILARLVAIDESTVDPSAWLDAKDLIVMLLQTITIEGILSRHQIFILNAVNKCSPAVVELLASFLLSNNSSELLISSGSLAVAIAFARRLNEEECTEKIARLLAPIMQVPEITQELLHQLSNAKKSQHRFRIYEVVLACCRIGNVHPGLKEFFDYIIMEVTADDILSQLAAMDFLSDIAICGQAMCQLLTDTGASSAVYNTLELAKNSPDGGFLYPGCIKYFGYLCRVFPHQLSIYSVFLSSLIDQVQHFDRLDPSLRLITFDTLANVAYSAAAKEEIVKLKGTHCANKMLSHFAVAIASGPVDLRARHLEALSILFGEPASKSNEEINQRWFVFLGQPFPKLLHDIIQKPFDNMRVAAISALAAILHYEFGKNAMFAVMGFKEWLLNNMSETQWEARQAKDNLIHELIASESPLITDSLRTKLKDYFVSSKTDPQVGMASL